MRELSNTPNAIRMRKRRQKMKADLIKFLGGKCRDCETEIDLQPHHIGPRDWRSNEVWSTTRLRRYQKEAAQGLVILLCGLCNRERGDPDGDGSF